MREFLRIILMPFAGIFSLTLALTAKANIPGATIVLDKDHSPG
jgi:hypothetical protein